MILEFLADGFEEIEALTPIDVLRRAGLDVKTVAVGKENDKSVVGAHGISVVADITSGEAFGLLKNNNLEMIILPGGMPGAKNLDESSVVDLFVSRAAKDGAYIASICAAPMIPGKRGLLRGRRAVCYPGFEKYLDGALPFDGKVAVDGKYVTACGMGAALEFALELVRLMKGAEAAENIRASILAK